ncbi:hypothetical protein KC887_10180 [Candidatus Kaiserbacteria bacterium]|nr:hypothetical protein [Candidatus Kaiserbacteria bacterium]
MSDKNKRPSMSDYGLNSFQGNAPEWSEQYQRQEKFVKALGEWEEREEQQRNAVQQGN